MNRLIFHFAVCFFIFFSGCVPQKAESPMEEDTVFAIAIHGGAGDGIKKGDFSDEKEKAYTDALTNALMAGVEVLESGGKAMDAVQATITLMEDSPLFNSAKGAVMTNQKTCELDASIMDGASLKAGAVCGVKTIKNPILAARKVMEASPHVMMCGDGADYFAKDQGLEIVDNSYFHTEDRLRTIERILEEEKMDKTATNPDEKKGTVGCVALDQYGNLAAGTSTGGMTNKRWGRVGDSPIIGAGTYANNETCAVSCTGHGEYYIRNVIAYDVSAQMEHGGKSLAEASQYLIHKKLVSQSGKGGLIAVDKDGNIALEYNTAGMFRASMKKGEGPLVEMY